MPGVGTNDLIFVMKQMQIKYLTKHMNLYIALVDLEKGFDCVPRDVIWWSGWYTRMVCVLSKGLYENAKSKYLNLSLWI